ncbi:coronin-2B-like [Astyanax mexicanus]|uniref:Coronin n=1 Tax=Astyanax mexicanus TaxID=7994 RepID=A0A8T2LCG2_ASTMX|nr:coronin-2B-like [Astyanax mexicanus]
MSDHFKMSWHPPYRSSKFRHVYGKPAGKDQRYDGLPITRAVHDNHCCAVNPRFIAVVTECAGGGAFIVISIRRTGRVDPHHPRVCGHRARVLDIKWDPFNDQRIASCSEDCTVKVWDIPNSGLKENIITARKELLGHSRRVGLIEWHPTAKDILLSSAYDYQVFVWCLDGAGSVVKTPVCVIHLHTDLVLSLGFNEDGSRLATTCKDRRIRIIDPRTGQLLQESGGQSHKASKVVFLTDLNLLLTTGNSCWNQRQFALWDPEDLSEPLLEEDVDGGSGVLFPFYDPDTHMLYLAGKGDGNIRYYEVSAEKPYIHFLAEYRSPLPQKGMGVMPKRGLRTKQCEIFRFYRMVCVKDLVEPLSFIVPRKFDGFQEDIYPMTAGNEAAMTAQEWLKGHNKGPVLMSLRPNTKVQNPYPAPVDVNELQRSFSSTSLQKPSGPNEAFLRLSQSSEYDCTDLTGWHEDGTQENEWSNTHPTHTPTETWWCESAEFTPPAVEKELLQVFYSQQEEIQSLRSQLEQRDSRIQQLELEVKNIRNQMRASF